MYYSAHGAEERRLLSLENNDRPVGGLQPEKANQIQLVVNRPETDEVTIDLGRVFHNMKLGARLFSWVLVFCILLGVSVPLLMISSRSRR